MRELMAAPLYRLARIRRVESVDALIHAGHDAMLTSAALREFLVNYPMSGAALCHCLEAPRRPRRFREALFLKKRKNSCNLAGALQQCAQQGAQSILGSSLRLSRFLTRGILGTIPYLKVNPAISVPDTYLEALCWLPAQLCANQMVVRNATTDTGWAWDVADI